MSSPPRFEASSALRREYLAVSAAFVALGTAAGNWGSRVPDVKRDLGLSEGALGSALLMLSIGAVAGSWIGGALMRRFGTRSVVRPAWIVLGIVVVAPAFATSGGALAGTLLVFGLAIGVLDVSMNGAGVLLEDAAARPLMNGLHAGWSAGVLLGAAMGVVAVVVGASTQVQLLVAGGIILASGVALGGRVIEDQTHTDGRVRSTTPHPLDRSQHRRLLALAAISGFVFLGEGAMLDWAGILVGETLGGGEILGVMAVIGVATGGLLGRTAGNRLTSALGPARLVRFGALASAVALGAVLVGPSAWPAPLLVVIVGAGMAPAVPLAFAAAGRLHGATGISIVTTAGYGCYLAGPAAIGWLAEHVGLRAALVLPLVLVSQVALLARSTGTDATHRDGTAHPEPV